MKQKELITALLALQDPKYREMQIRLIPNIAPEMIIGVRTPDLRRLAKELVDCGVFINNLPHDNFEENQIHSFLLGSGKDFANTVAQVDAFLPYVDNWATCDQLSPKIFKKHRQELLSYIFRWIESDHPYTIRFGIEMLMVHFLDEEFVPQYLSLVAGIMHEDYYVKMMVAWYFATALAKQFDSTFPYISGYRLEKWTHNKAIQKSVESYRITPEQKEILRQYRLK